MRIVYRLSNQRRCNDPQKRKLVSFAARTALTFGTSSTASTKQSTHESLRLRFHEAYDIIKPRGHHAANHERCSQ